MVTTRSAAEKGQPASSSGEHAAAAAGKKHVIEDKSSPTTKKKSKTTAATHGKEQEQTQEQEQKQTQKQTQRQATIEETISGHETSPSNSHGENARAQATSPPKEQKDSQPSSSGAVESQARGDAVPSSILEKGIIYFFFRGRVGIDEPTSVDDVSRSYVILRPIQNDAKLGEGTIGDAGNSRLIAIPKKVLPLSGKDRWISFVEKVNISFQTLKDEFLASNDYVTKTAGTRHTPAATPIGEGVYAITTTGRESHLAYMLTLPAELGEVQEEIGLRKQGSFILSTRNPAYPPPGSVGLPEGPKFTEEIQDEFRALRWMPSQPKHLNFTNSQILLIGESGLQKATEPQEDDIKEGKDQPQEELETLEAEDTKRMEDLKGGDSAAIFADLEVNAKDYPKLQTTF